MTNKWMPQSTFDQVILNIKELSDIFFKKTQDSKVKSILLDEIRMIESDVFIYLENAFSNRTSAFISSEFNTALEQIIFSIDIKPDELKFKMHFDVLILEATKIRLEALSTILDTKEAASSKGGQHCKAPIALCAAVGELARNNPKITAFEAWRALKKLNWRGEINNRSYSLAYDSYDDVLIQSEYIAGNPLKELRITQTGVRDHLSKAKKFYRKKHTKQK